MIDLGCVARQARGSTPFGFERERILVTLGAAASQMGFEVMGLERHIGVAGGALSRGLMVVLVTRRATLFELL